jgi:carnitine O-acetyltransferase
VRTSLIYINFFGVDCVEPPPAKQIERTASFIASALKFKQMIDAETLMPDRLFGTLPMCMRQYRRLFSTSRIPEITKDALVTYSPEESRHVVVVRKNQFFWFDVYHRDGSGLSRSQLKRHLQQVVDLSNDSGNPDPPVGALTTENRSTWAVMRKKLIDEDEYNKVGVDRIEKALFVVCLDDEDPQNMDEHARLMFHGDGRNRWFDKSLQIIVQKDGQLGPNVEHSRGETPTAIPLFDFAAADEKKVENAPEPVERDLPPVSRIRWKLNAEIEKAIETACRNFDAMAADFDVKVFAFPTFGKGFAKSCNLSPDGFVQMALQLTSFKMYKRRVLTYETASTRLFYHGNTDTIRSCSLPSMEFVTAMQQSDFSAATKFDFLKKAVEAHVRYTRAAMAGKAVDRHLLGLRILASENEPELPGIFTDKAYQMSWQLSTSQSPARRLVVGFAQASDDGYGVSYLVKENCLHFIITSKHSCPDTDSTRFAASLEHSLSEMQNVCELALRLRN